MWITLKSKKTPSNNHAGPGVEDFDRENAGDPQQHSDYAMETFQYYKNREETFRVPDYLQVIHLKRALSALPLSEPSRNQ